MKKRLARNWGIFPGGKSEGSRGAEVRRVDVEDEEPQGLSGFDVC